MNILIIEDDPMVAMIHQEFIKRVFKEVNVFNVMTLKDAKIILNDTAFNCVLLDNYLIDGKGVDLLSDIKDIPVIMITAANDVDTVKRAMKYGAIDYLVKPFTFERFQKAMERLQDYQQMVSRTKISQNILDQYFIPQKEQGNLLPKGLANITLKKIAQAIYQRQDTFTTQQIAQDVDISRITIKKYLNYLVDNGYLQEDAQYATLGRPVAIYTTNYQKLEQLLN